MVHTPRYGIDYSAPWLYNTKIPSHGIDPSYPTTFAPRVKLTCLKRFDITYIGKPGLTNTRGLTSHTRHITDWAGEF